MRRTTTALLAAPAVALLLTACSAAEPEPADEPTVEAQGDAEEAPADEPDEPETSGSTAANGEIVPAADWADAVCTAVRETSDNARLPLQDPTQFVRFGEVAEEAHTGVLAAGVPDIEGGAEVATAVESGVAAIVDVYSIDLVALADEGPEQFMGLLQTSLETILETDRVLTENAEAMALIEGTPACEGVELGDWGRGFGQG